MELISMQGETAHDLLTPELNEENNTIALIHAMTSGDYMTKFESSSDLANALQSLVDKLHKTSSNELDHLVGLSISNNEACISSAQLLYALKNVEAYSHQIAAAAEEMQGSVVEVKHYSENIESGATKSLTTAKEVGNTLLQAVHAFTNIEESVAENAVKLSNFSNFTKKITDIADQIKAIAFQSNILAMNSSVEAARAGDHGRGFAVIGQEIHLLSRKSEDAIAQIAQLVKGYDADVKEITASLNNSQTIVKKGQDAVSAVNQNMDNLIEEFQVVSENTSQISEALREQTTAATDVAKGINTIAGHALRSVESSDSIVDAINQIQAQIDKQILVLSELNVAGKIIKLAKSDHVIWKKKLVSMIAGKEGLQSSELADHNSCRLGKWYNQVTDKSLTRHPAFKSLLEPHRLVHAHGKAAVDLYNSRNIGAALNEIKVVEQQSSEVLRLLAVLETV